MLNDKSKEVIFVGLPGPTHNYGGLSSDNVASSTHRGQDSNPKSAAFQALALVRLLKSLGLTAGVLPPQLRPNLALLRTEFEGSDDEVIKQAAAKNPVLLEKACSSSAMWTANAATVTAAQDSSDHALHLTTANLQTNLHRRIEAADTHRVLTAIFGDVKGIRLHAPLAADLRDEGAANHMRLAPSHEDKGLNVFVYGTDGSAGDPPSARQTLAASQAVAKSHNMPGEQALFIKQHPDLIRQGVFHNDVIAVANGTVLLAHETAYANGEEDLARIEQAYRALHKDAPYHPIIIRAKDLSVEEAVRTYFFNSQIVTLEGGKMAIIAPTEVRDLYDGKAARLMDAICADKANPVQAVHYADLRQSMNNGGGPACLRLRVPMGKEQLAAIDAKGCAIASDAMIEELEALIQMHYPDKVRPTDLADPALYHRCREALTAMAGLLKLPLI